jgi:O-antigen/teichoic acid export membrane protein
LLGILLFLNFLPIINNAFLQGLQRFAWLSTSSAVAILFKIVLAATLVWWGYGLAGALGGIILTAVATWLITYGAIRRPLRQGRDQPYRSEHLSFKGALPVLAANAAFAAMTQLDMVVVNHYFSAHDAGLYAAASVLGKAVLYLPGGIAMALFPMVAENNARDESSAHLLLQAVGLTALLCTVGALAYFVLGEWIIVLFYGEGYRGAGPILRYFGFAILPMALVLVAEHFLIAKGRVLFAYLFVVIAPLQLTAIYLWHPTLQAVLVVMGVSGLLLSLIGYGLLWRSFRKSIASGETPT